MKKNIALLLATILILTGCTSDYIILPSISDVIITADSSVKLVNNTITFTVKDNLGTNLTSDAVFYVNNVAIEGNTFTSAVTGTFEVKANYLGISSVPLIVTFTDGTETNFVKRLLVEDYTGTWCGYCPRVAFAIEQLHAQSENVVAVAIHRPSSNMSSAVYDPYNYDTTELEDLINVPGYPKGMLNRTTQWGFPEPDNIAQAIALTQGENPKLGLALQPVINGRNISLTVKTQFSKNFENLKLVVYVLENGLVYAQHNYTDYYNSEDVIQNYTHNHVLRGCLTPLLGENISNSESVLNGIYTKTFNAPLPASVTNAANVEFVAFVVDATGKTVNVRKAAAGNTQEFEIL